MLAILVDLHVAPHLRRRLDHRVDITVATLPGPVVDVDGVCFQTQVHAHRALVFDKIILRGLRSVSS